MSDERSIFEIDQAKKAGGKTTLPPPLDNQMTRRKAGRPVTFGFVMAAGYFVHAMVNRSIVEIGLTNTLMQLAGIVGICLLASMGFKAWMGRSWSNQHMFEKIIQFTIDTCQGVGLFVMTFGVFGFFFLRG